MSRAIDPASNPRPPATSPYKSRDGLGRIGSALRYPAAVLLTIALAGATWFVVLSR